MPATFAHPAFAWPLRWAGLPFAALCVGSMVPDIAHLLPRRSWTDHTALSVVTFSLPVGLAVYLVYARWVAPGLAVVAPGPWRHPLAAAARDLPLDFRVVVAVGLGAGLHVAVDATTHPGGAVVEALPFPFRAEIAATPFGPLRVHQLLQYGGGLAGSVFLAVQLGRWLRAHPTRRPRPRDFVGLALAVAAVGLLSALEAHRQSWWLAFPTRLQDFLVVGATSALLLVTGLAVVVASAVHLARALRGRGTEPS